MGDDDNLPARRGLTTGRIEAGAAVAGVLVAVVGLLLTVNNRDDEAPLVTPTETGTYYFVYGTTKPGHLRYPLIEEFVAEATPTTVSGRLFDSGSGYPAAKFGGGQATVEGYLLRIRPERVFEAERTFTDIESGLFQAVRVETEAGVSATAYEWIGSTEGFEPIESGVWDGEES